MGNDVCVVSVFGAVSAMWLLGMSEWLGTPNRLTYYLFCFNSAIRCIILLIMSGQDLEYLF